MKIEEVPEGHWMILNNKREVMFHNESLGIVNREGKKYKDVFIERKFTGLVF